MKSCSEELAVLFFSNILIWQNKKLSSLCFPNHLELEVHEVQTLI